MAGWNDDKGACMNGKTIEERVRALEEYQRRNDGLIRSAAGQLRRAKKANSVEELREVLLAVAGQLEAAGRGSEK